jgi:hypothetical protein
MAVRRRKTKRHSVKASLTVHALSKAGTALALELFHGGQKIGQLEVGRGSLYWTGRQRHRSKRLSWTRFAEMMDQLAYGA